MTLGTASPGGNEVLLRRRRVVAGQTEEDRIPELKKA